MKFYPPKLYFRHRPVLIMNILSLLANVAMWLWLIIEIPPQSETVFLHYNILFGVDFTGEWWQVFYVPLTGIFILVLNNFLGWYLFNRDKFFAYIFLFSAFFAQVFLLVGASLLVFLNV